MFRCAVHTGFFIVSRSDAMKRSRMTRARAKRFVLLKKRRESRGEMPGKALKYGSYGKCITNLQVERPKKRSIQKMYQ